MRHILTYALFEATQEKKTTPPVKIGALTPPKLTPKAIENNKSIAKTLADKNIRIAANPSSQNFLPQVAQYFVDKGLEPYLSVNTDDKGANQSVSPGLTFTVPNKDISFSVQQGYFGVDLPFLKGTSLGVEVQGGKQISGGYRDSAAGDFKGNAKYAVSLTIPLTK